MLKKKTNHQTVNEVLQEKAVPVLRKKPGSSLKKTLLLLLLLLITPTILGFTSGTVPRSSVEQAGETRAISGRVTGLDPAGGTVALLDARGNTIPVKNTTVNTDGTFRLEVDTVNIPESPGYVLWFSKKNKVLRSLVMAWAGTTDYSGEEAVISPLTEAAYLLCALTSQFNYSDYVAFLKAYTGGKYNFEAPSAYDFSFREIFPEVVTSILDYTTRVDVRKPDQAMILDLLEDQRHTLNTASPRDHEDIRFIRKTLVTGDRSGLVFITYPHEDSNMVDLPLVAATTESFTDGNISWKTYTLDIGNDIPGALKIKAADVTALPLNKSRKLSTRPGSSGVPASGTRFFSEVTGQLRVSLSDIAPFIDVNACGLVPDPTTNTQAVFLVKFKKALTATGLVIQFIRVDGHGKNKFILAEVPITDETVYRSPMLDLTDPANLDKFILAEIKNSEDVLYSMSDPVDVTRYQASRPMIAMAKMNQTRADPTGSDIYNNIGSSNDTNISPIAAGNVATHYILDLDRFLGTGVMPLWDNTAYGQNPIGDGSGRIPLVVIHGWQGGFGLRDAARLCLWENSPVHGSCNWIEYYLSKPELQEAYHLYYVRWPSYKHIEFSGSIFTQLLLDVKKNRPETDLAAGMGNQDLGVAIITHSTGGLIARTAIESHLAFSNGTDKFAYLRAALLMASPNHGTPGAVNISIQKSIFDLTTQASGDLEWDSFDGNSDIKFDGVKNFSYLEDRPSRWNPDSQNLKAYDTYYLGLLANPDYQTYNPWLVWFNRAFGDTQDALKNKYILYSGWIRTDILFRKKYNTLKNGLKMDTAGILMDLSGYQNDAVLTVSSNLFAVNPGDKAFNPIDDTQIPTTDWYPNSDVHFTYNWDTHSPTTVPVAIFGDPQDHPRGMAFRLFWDYDHINLRAGAMDASHTFGSFDTFLGMGDIIADDVDIPDIFKTEDLRRDFIRAALSFTTGTDPGFIQSRYNPLRFEPIFLCMEKDLMNLADPSHENQ